MEIKLYELMKDKYDRNYNQGQEVVSEVHDSSL